MHGIQGTVYNNLMEFFKNQSDITQVILFGSRAKNTASLHSDIDLCITYCGKVKGNIMNEIDKLVGIYSCDIVFSDQLNNEIKKQIDRDGVLIYRKDFY